LLAPAAYSAQPRMSSRTIVALVLKRSSRVMPSVGEGNKCPSTFFGWGRNQDEGAWPGTWSGAQPPAASSQQPSPAFSVHRTRLAGNTGGDDDNLGALEGRAKLVQADVAGDLGNRRKMSLGEV
jgi:hypothetical protein